MSCERFQRFFPVRPFVNTRASIRSRKQRTKPIVTPSQRHTLTEMRRPRAKCETSSEAGKRRRFGFETTSMSEMLSTRDACDPLLNVPKIVCSCQPRIKCNSQRVRVPNHADIWGRRCDRPMSHQVLLKRAYEKPTRSDGFRVLVDRLWPRGISKVKLQLDLWEKAVAPSTELRQWFDHDPAKWTEFRKRYHAELRHAASRHAIDETLDAAKSRSVITLVYGAKDTEHNEAVVLQGVLQRRLRR